MIAAALLLNSVIFSVLALNFLGVVCGYHWPTMKAKLRQEWPCALVMAVLGFGSILVVLIIAVFAMFGGRAPRQAKSQIGAIKARRL